MVTEIARHSVGEGFAIAVITRAGRRGFQVVRIDERINQFVALFDEPTEAAARRRANAVWSADMGR